MASFMGQHGSIWAWSILLLIVNLPLLWGEIRTGLLFLPQAVGEGQWWRMLTFPLVHLSWYHLLLDAGGFLLLFGCLEEKRWFPRTLYITFSGAGALLMALALDPAVATQGLSGLSGIAHGLMAVAALEMLRHKDQRKWGWISLVTVVGKSAYELWTGQVLFEFIHMGMCGQPMAACHAGGVLGALIAFVLVRIRPGRCPSPAQSLPGKATEDAPQGTAIQSFLGLAMQILARLMYRVRYRGLERIPDRGAAVLVCNHVSYVDWLIIASACRRPVHFVMHAAIYRMPLLNWILRLARAIPIESGRKNPVLLREAFDRIASVLNHGGLVCIFPEGRLTRTGRIDRFRPGIERIVRNTPVPVVPLALQGMWGSFFSHKHGTAMRRRPRKIWAPVELTVGPKVHPGMATAPHLRLAVQHLHGETT
jgi:rhomboid family GlyGly-CTERM serine protease